MNEIKGDLVKNKVVSSEAAAIRFVKRVVGIKQRKLRVPKVVE